MRKGVAALVLVMLAVVVWLLLTKNQNSLPPAAKENAAQTPAAPTPANRPAPAKTSPQTVAAIATNPNPAPATVASRGASRSATAATAGIPAEAEFTAIAPEIVLENVRTAFRNFGSTFGGNPVGTNLEITRALAGENRRQINFINPEAGLRVNDRGEMIDPWGTPFFFHQLSGTEMEIHSAGPDRKMWTTDDLVTK